MGWSTHFRAVAIAAAVSAIITFGATSPAAGAEIVPTPSSAPDDAAHLSEPVEPTGGSPAAETPAADEPAAETPATDEPAADEPAAETPAAETPAAETPAADEPAAETPAARSAEVTLQATAASVITPFGPGVHRLSGDDRYQTAVAISKRFGAGVPILYVATAADFPDALTAAAAAAHLGGPLLVTRTDALPDVVRTEIARLAPKRIVVAGGESVVGADVYDDLATMTPSITRLGGSDRYETGALLISDAFTSATQAFVATGGDFPDALAASAAAGYLGAPVFLVDGQSAFAPTYATASMESLGVSTVRIAGAGGAVSLAMETDLVTRGFDVMRHEGADRYVTAAAINKAVFRGISPGSAFIATGADFADALAGAALAGGLDAPLFLTRGTCIPPLVADSLDVLAPAARVILGGPGAVGETVAQDTVCGMGWVKPATGRITDVFGPRAPICTPGGCSQSFHRGVDLGTGCWSPIYAASDGRVTTAGRVGTYGNFVKISHGSGIDTGYAHLVDGGTLVSVGQLVTAGDQIGWSGATGAAFGCHLHFEVYQGGVQIDPLPFMSARGITLG